MLAETEINDGERKELMKTRPVGFLGIKTADTSVVKILNIHNQDRSATIFTTVVDGQKTASLDFYYRSTEDAAWVYVDSLAVKSIPPAQAGEPDLTLRIFAERENDLVIEIEDPAQGRVKTFTLDLRGLMPVSGVEQIEVSEKRTPGSSDPQGSKRRRRRSFWIVLAALTGTLIIALVLFGRDLVPLESMWKSIVAQYARSGLTAFPGKSASRPATPLDAALDAGQTDRASPTGKAPSTGAAPSTGIAPSTSAAPSTRTVRPAVTVPPVVTVTPAVTVPSVDAGKAMSTDASQLEAPTSAENHVYRILWGDTLWRISERYYGNRDLFPELAESNALADPDMIIAGESLVLPSELGESAIIQKNGNNEE
jgi:LysM repeat protein